ncbi:MAG: mucoidy inhibitor MuiA family protein [Thermogemmatispora sp.]|uniref:mucoidy inhibitor MuiA family protein n=1 Tax=Thermogemmatispora sp. TaxID=1968838 RepID=UPI00262EC7F5|nr:mucoidy inhibitor MuiA family protein [Thermogemmatispora sp.]MBX5455819.1 mucoidy inhibitor MuiA family protein [Thermogemmatispora sp.]
MVIELETRIVEVTVYGDRALVKRQGSLSLEEGEHELRVNYLPHFLKDSLRASGRGPAGTRLLGVEATTAFLARPPEQELLRLQTACDLLERKIQLLQARQQALEQRRRWVQALGEQAPALIQGLTQGRLQPGDYQSFFAALLEQMLQDAEAAQDVAIQLHQLQEEWQAKKRELEQKRLHSDPDRLAVLVTVELPRAGELMLELSYLIEGAAWRPSYDARLSFTGHDGANGNAGQESSVDLTCIGLVEQRTGEDWNEVALALSTARPAQATVLPKLEPWYLDTFQPVLLSQAFASVPPPPLGMSSQQRRAMLAAPMSALPEPAPAAESQVEDEALASEEVVESSAEIEQRATALVYHCGRSVNIPSDGSPHRTLIAQYRLPCRLEVVAIPALEEVAHLRATVENSSGGVLLKGKANIFVDEEYVGTTEIDLTAPSQTFRLFLGLDDSVRIRRELIERTVEQGSRLQGNLRRITYAYRITVENFAQGERRIIIMDRVPISRHERIKVRIISLLPEPQERSKLEQLTWQFTLPAGGKQQIEERFLVEHPRDFRVSGLP